MASVPDICNLSLGHLGDQATVASISPPDGSTQAAHCARLYPIARDMILEAHTWGFATVRVAAAPVTNPLTSWRYAYALPANCLKIVSVLPPAVLDDDTDTQAFVVEQDGSGNGVVYTNVQQATLRYIVRVTDTTKFSTAFVVALSLLLGSLLAGPVLKGKVGTQAMSSLKQAYESELGKAKELDANAQNKDTMRTYQPLHLRDRTLPDTPQAVSPWPSL